MIFEFKFGEDVGVDEGDGDSGVRIFGVIDDVGDVGIVRGESGEDVVVIVEIEGDGVGQFFSP